MRFGWHGKTDGINASIRACQFVPLNVVLLSDFVRRGSLMSQTLRLRRPSSESVGVNARMLLPRCPTPMTAVVGTIVLLLCLI